MAGHVTTVGLLGMKAHQLFVHHVRMFYIWHPKYITVVRLKWSSLCSFNKHMGQTAQVWKGPEMNLPRLPCRHPSVQENASIGFKWFQPLRMVSSVFVLQACFLSKLWVKAEQRSAHAVRSFCLEHSFQHSWSSSMIRCIHCNLGIPTYPTALFVKSEFPQAWQKNSSSHLTKTAIGNSKPTPVPWTFFGFMSDMSSHSLGEHHHTLLSKQVEKHHNSNAWEKNLHTFLTKLTWNILGVP